MNRKLVAGIAFIWVVSLVGVAASAAVWAKGGQNDLRRVPMTFEGQPVGEVISGQSIGFQRIAAEPTKDGKVIGRWMVKVDGVWKETQPYIGIVR